jgi:hypothetical protein
VTSWLSEGLTTRLTIRLCFWYELFFLCSMSTTGYCYLPRRATPLRVEVMSTQTHLYSLVHHTAAPKPSSPRPPRCRPRPSFSTRSTWPPSSPDPVSLPLLHHHAQHDLHGPCAILSGEGLAPSRPPRPPQLTYLWWPSSQVRFCDRSTGARPPLMAVGGK